MKNTLNIFMLGRIPYNKNCVMLHSAPDNCAMQCQVSKTIKFVPECVWNVWPAPISHQTIMRMTIMLYCHYKQMPLWKSLVLVRSGEADYTCWFWAFQFSCATMCQYRANSHQYNQIYIYWLISFEWISPWFRMKPHVTQLLS